MAGLLLVGTDEAGWQRAIVRDNVLKARHRTSGIRLARLVRHRLEPMSAHLWRMVRDAPGDVATHAVLAAAIKHSRLLGDFLDLVVRDQHRRFAQVLTPKHWEDYILDCRGRDPRMPQWNESTIRRLRSSVFQILAQAGYLRDTRSLTLQRPKIASEVTSYLRREHEDYVLRCITVGT